MLPGHETIEHDRGLLVKAMQPQLSDEVANQPQGVLYRLALDAFFTRLDWIAHRVTSGLIAIEDVPDLKYWLKKLANWPYAPSGIDGRTVFVPFLRGAEYDEVLNLMRKFGVLSD